jgi:hypothetical protein
MPRELIRSVSWRPETWDGNDTCSLYRLDGGWELTGEVNATVETDQFPLQFARTPQQTVSYKLTYTMQMDEEWQSRLIRVQVSSRAPKLTRGCTLSISRDGIWKHKSGNMTPDTRYLTDVFDFTLDVTPALRVQQVRRRELAADADDDVDVARLTLPDFDLSPVSTTLARTGENVYECLETIGFNAYESTFTVDDLGLVIDQEGSWSRSGGFARNTAS